MRDRADHDLVGHYRVLLVEGSATDADMILRMLSEVRGAMAVGQGVFSLTHADCLATAIDLLTCEAFSAVLLDLTLADSSGLKALGRIRKVAADVPVVVLAGSDDDGLALRAIQCGAQDYLAKDRLVGPLVRRTLRHAIERQRVEVQLLRRTRQIEAAHAQIEEQAAQLECRAEQLDRVNRELDDFAYIASHDLKEPLRGIQAYCELLLEEYGEKLDGMGRRRLATLVDLCHRLETLIGNLLTYSRLGAGRPAEGDIDFGQVVDTVLETLRPAIDCRGGSVRVVGQLPKVRGDATLVGMVLGNLISNGLKFNDRSAPRLEIGCVMTGPPTFYVRDDGIGIDPADHDAIFTIFRRLHGRKKYDGTGAGLTIVRKIVEMHGGRVWVESAAGLGSTFFFTLAPAERGSVEPLPPRPPHWVEEHRTASAEHSGRLSHSGD